MLSVAKVAVILPTIDEASHIDAVIDSIEAQTAIQEHPENFELILADSSSTDGTPEIAEDRGWRVIQAGKGKLTARDAAMRATNADLIFSIDADVYYPPKHFATYLRHFDDPQVVGVYGPFGFDTRATDTPIWLHLAAPWLFLSSWLSDRYFMLGQNSVYKREAYLKAPFDLSVNQLDHTTMRLEEEFWFREKLAKQGKVVFEAFSVPLTNPRRITGNDTAFNKDRQEKRRFARTSWFSS